MIAMPRIREGHRMNSSTLTGIAAVLFGCGLVALIAAMFRDAAHGGPLLWIGLALLIATVICWFMAAHAEGARS
jgi:MFS-type transporter involved in bile tolerance (Atg22 family)